VVFVSGDGPQDRDGGLGHAGLFHVLADSLVVRGLVVLRHDDRGAGGSSAVPGPPSYRALLGDTRAALAFVRGRKEVDPDRVVLIGHSEGAKTCEVLAARDPKLAGIVLLGGATAVNVDSLLEEQARLNPGGPAANLLPTLARAKQGERARGATDLEDWMREHLELSPRSLLPRIRCPVLIVQGGADQLVREHHAREAAALLEAGGNPDVSVRVFPGLSHVFNHWTPGGERSPALDAADPAVAHAIAEWVLTRTTARKHR
jgi:pimeloyl-ACP methyl ester carboxylesterase